MLMRCCQPTYPVWGPTGAVNGVYCSAPPVTESSALLNVWTAPTAVSNGATPTNRSMAPYEPGTSSRPLPPACWHEVTVNDVTDPTVPAPEMTPEAACDQLAATVSLPAYVVMPVFVSQSC